jgi:hypothetical protein
MTTPTNTFTVTFADAHSHSVQFPGIPGNANMPDGGKADALASLLDNPNVADGSALSVLTAGDTLTVTVTQP